MKFLNKFFFFIILIFISTAISHSNEPIGYIDIDFVIKNSNIGKEKLKKINLLNDENIEEFKRKEKILKDLEIEIASKKNIVSKEAFDNELILFKKKIDTFKKEQKKIITIFNDYKKKEIDNIFTKISPIINDYMEQNSVKILFDVKNIFMGRNDLNFTNDILKKINKEIK